MHNLWIDGRNLQEMGIVVSGEGTYNAPEYDYTTQSVPGLNGDLILDNGRYKNIAVKYPAGITQNFARNAEDARHFLLGYGAKYRRIQDDYHPGLFRLGIYSGGIDFDMGFLNRCGETTLTFNCKPQRFFLSGESPITVQSGQALYNNWMPTKPVLLVTGNGTLTVGGTSITVSGTSGEFTIDCEKQDAWQGLNNLNGNIEVENHIYPTIPGGKSDVNFTGIEQLKIIPRWWTL